jgi:hypothetical protein
LHPFSGFIPKTFQREKRCKKPIFSWAQALWNEDPCASSANSGGATPPRTRSAMHAFGYQLRIPRADEVKAHNIFRVRDADSHAKMKAQVGPWSALPALLPMSMATEINIRALL